MPPLKLFSRKLKLPRKKLFVIPTKPHKTSLSHTHTQTDVHAHLHHIYINTLHQLLQLSPALAPRFRNEILILSAPTNQDSQDTNTGNAPPPTSSRNCNFPPHEGETQFSPFAICGRRFRERGEGGRGKFKYCFVSGTGKTVTLWICMIMEQIVASVLQTEFVVKFTLRPGVLLHSGGWERWCLMMGPRFHPAAPNCLRWWWQWPRLGLNRPQNVWALWFQTLVLTSLGKLSRQKWGREEI